MSPCSLKHVDERIIQVPIKAKIFLYDSGVGKVGTGAGGVLGVGVGLGGELFMYDNH